MEQSKVYPTLALVVPCYNEEEMIPLTIKTLKSLLKGLITEQLIAPNSFALFVDDGSSDATLRIIRETESTYIKALKLASNVGHQQALMAGLTYVTDKCNCAISLDADLQDDINVIYEMLAHYKQGAHVVYGIREDRKTDSSYKRNTAQLFYRLMEKMGVNLVYNHADYRLTSNTVLKELLKYKEVNLFLRGIFPKMGFTAAYVYYKRKSRVAGESKYPFRKMVGLAINGITSFSNIPLKIITYVGFAIFIVSIALSAWVVVVRIQGTAVPGWASITLPIYFIGGVQLLALGILGEYIGKIYLETKARPLFHIEEVIEHANAYSSQNNESEQVKEYSGLV
jgi:polyisoprenyl-phosphate glycosyltransferase